MDKEKLIKINESDVDCTNIVVDENYPLEKCGYLNDAGKVVVRGIVSYSDVRESHFDKDGILQIVGEAIDNTII
ncbi:MAG TPA: hypothetical protein VGK38_08635 [Prolixibacteraceae bacterium]